MPATSFLPPITAIRMVWALTGSFSNDEHSKHAALLAESSLKDIQQLAEKHGSNEEKEYVLNAIACMESSIRSLDTVYKGRQLNFEENEKLRSAYLESVKENLDFGKKAQDFLRSLPSMSIGAAGGVTIAKAIGFSNIQLWGVGIALAAVGYIINLLFVRRARRQRQLLYVSQDYERGLYYDRYVSQVALILTSLYMDIDRIHKKVFGESYPIETESIGEVVNDLLEGVRPTLCKFVHKHMREKKIAPELWSFCETGNLEAVKNCSFWEDKKT